jgi:hypothetical protein
MPDMTPTERRTFVLQMRDNGHSYAEIANASGYAHAGAARRAVIAALIAAGRENEIPEGRAVSFRTSSRTTRTVVVPTLEGFHTTSNLTFGIEIECIGLSMNSAARALQNANIACFAEGYTHRVMNTWKVVPDGSLNSRSGSCEVVSPVLRGNAGLDEVRSVMAILRTAGARINQSCGMHIHIGVDSFTREQQANIIRNHQVWQPAFDSLLTEFRRSNTRWAKRRNASNAAHIARNWADGSNDVATMSVNADRYHSLNINSFHKYGTYEFRSHHGSLNGKNATAWIALHLAFIEMCAKETTEGTEILSRVENLDYCSTTVDWNTSASQGNELGRLVSLASGVEALKRLTHVLVDEEHLQSEAATFLNNRSGNIPARSVNN